MKSQAKKTPRTKHSFYRQREWYRMSALTRRRDGHRCVICKTDVSERGKSRVDHIIPRHERPDLALDITNLRTLCGPCDNSRHAWDRASSEKIRKEITLTGAPVGEPDWV